MDNNGSPIWPGGEDLGGVPVAPGSNLSGDYALVPDGAGGAIFAWTDARSGNNDIYAQHLGADGQALWATAGIEIFAATYNQGYPPRTINVDENSPSLLEDGSGGAFVVYESPFVSTVGHPPGRVQRIAGDGAFLWPDDVWLTFSGAFIDFHRMVPDGRGGVIVLWAEWTSLQGPSRYNLRAQRLTPQGQKLWHAYSGVSLTPAVHDLPQNPVVVPDGSGGFFVVYQNGTGIDPNLYAQRVNAEGNVLWQPAGASIRLPPAGGEGHRLIAPLSAAAIVAWNDGDIWAQYLNYNGILGTVTSIGDGTQSWRASLFVQSPVRARTRVFCDLPVPANLSLRVFDARGRERLGRDLGRTHAGLHQWDLDLSALSSGSYWIRLEGAGEPMSRKVTILP